MTPQITPTLDGMQKLQVDDWLRQADRMIREGRYLKADEYIQKITAIQPENDMARAYQDRIQFLIKQLSQRIGLSKEIQTEIRKYRDLVIQRKGNQVSALLVEAQKLLEGGFIRKAHETANRARLLDSENMYTKALLQRIDEIQLRAGSNTVATERELQFCALLRESWRNGVPDEAQQEHLKKMQEQFGVEDARRLQLERELRNSLYKDALNAIWATGGLAAFTPESIDALRAKYAISRVDHSFIETTLLRETRKNRIKGTALIVESNTDLLLEITTQLRQNFYAVIAAGSLDEALLCVNTTTPDIILSGVNLEGGSGGFDLYEIIRSMPATLNTPFLFLTPALDRSTQLIAKRLGVDDFFTIPIDYELLFATLAGKLFQRGHSRTGRILDHSK